MDTSFLPNVSGIADLIPIINEYYRSYPIFAIGKYGHIYPGYRNVIVEDLQNNNFHKKFTHYFELNKGLYSLDFFKKTDEQFSIILCIDDEYLFGINENDNDTYTWGGGLLQYFLAQGSRKYPFENILSKSQKIKLLILK